MIKPEHNEEAAYIFLKTWALPSIRFIRRSMLARKCNGLVMADRYLAKKDKEGR